MSTATKALAAAQRMTETVEAAEARAAENVTATAEALERMKAEATKVMVAIARQGDSPETRQRIEDTRRRLKEAETEAEFAELQHHATKTAVWEAFEEAAVARRAVAAEEFIAAHAAYNDPAGREAVLLAQITESVVELIPLIRARRELHNRLFHEVASFPNEERGPVYQKIPAGGCQWPS